MEKFRGVDYYGVEALLSDEERMVRDAVRDWVEAEFLPLVTEHHRAGTFPMTIVPQLGELGIFGASLKGYGCAGLSNVAYGLIMQELERGDSGLRSFASVQSGLVMYPIHRFGSDAQKDRWLPALQQGAAIGCFGLTEPDHGSDPGGMATRAVRQGDHYVLNGTKLWITNGSIADVAVVWAKDEAGEIGGYLVERGTPGFGALDIHGKFSMRASITSELSFQDCRIPLANRLPGAKGLRRRRSPACPRPATGSPGAPSAPPRPATTGRSSTGRRASSSASPSPGSSSSSGSSCGWSRRSPRRSSCACSSGASRTAPASAPSRCRWRR